MLAPRPSLAVTVAVSLLAAASCSGSSAYDPPSAALEGRDVAEAAGVSAPSNTHGENCIADVDEDGLLDVILSFHEDVWPLMWGRPDGVFEQASELDLAARDRHGCAVADFDGDGRLDIYFSIGACRGTCEAPKELWIQQPDGTFAEEADLWGISDPGARGRVPLVVEVNGDGRPDLFTGAEAGVDFPSLSRLWINAGDHFELAHGPLTNDIGNLCAAAADLDGDGLDEVAICTPEDGFHLYRNRGGDYVEATAEFGLEGYGRRTVEFVDLDGDGDQDLATVARSRVQVHPNEGGFFGAPMFDVTAKDAKDVAFGDLDGDDDIDIYLQEGAESSAPDRVYLNDGNGQFSLGPDVPVADEGAGDSVVTFTDWRGQRSDAFLVNNGFQETPGPRQLIIFEEA